MAPPNNGLVAQDVTIAVMTVKLIACGPNVTVPTPTNAPTKECVVDTGKEKYVATANQINAPDMVDIITTAYNRTPSSPNSTKRSTLKIPPEIMPATSPPAKDPKNSQTPAI